MAEKIALIAGATGIIAKGLVDVLAQAPEWTLRTLGRTPSSVAGHIQIDLLDARQAVPALKAQGADVTHLFYAAYQPQPDLAAEVEVNGPMLETLLDGLLASGAPLRRVVLYQGAKVYGVHLGKIQAPFYEDETPRHLPPNFYYTQEDLLRSRAAAQGLEWSILRPDVVVGDAVGNPMNIAMVIGVYAALSKAAGAPLRFPGPQEVYDGVFVQVTDSQLLGRASLWAATADAARNEAFNYVHEPFRWKRVFSKVAEAFDMELGPPMPMSLTRHMALQESAWTSLVKHHSLQGPPYAQLVGWSFGDFVFNTRFDMISDMGKIRRAGFAESIDSASAVVNAIRRLQNAKVLPAG
jgi:nucleoside-diphosphate-sugar epimerase